MIQYAKSEIYRMFKTPMYRYFMVFSLVVMVVFTAMLKPIGLDDDFFEYMAMFESLASLIILSILGVMVFKTKDTKVQIISYGISKTRLYIMDTVVYIINTLITFILLYITAIVFGYLGKFLGVASFDIESLKFFTIYTLRSFVAISLLLSSTLGTVYLFNSLPLGLLYHFMFLDLFINISSAFIKSQVWIDRFDYFRSIQPLRFYNTFPLAPFEDWIVIGKDIIIGTIIMWLIYATIGLIAINKREID